MTVLVAKLFFCLFAFETELQDGRIDVYITARASFCAFIFTCMYQQRYRKKKKEKKKKNFLTRHCDKGSKVLPLCFFQLTTPATRSVEEQTLGTVAFNLLIS